MWDTVFIQTRVGASFILVILATGYVNGRRGGGGIMVRIPHCIPRVDPVSLLWGCCIHQQSPKSSLTPTRGDHIEFDVRMSQLKENRTLVSMCGPTATCIKIPMKFRFLTHGKALIAGQLASGTRVRFKRARILCSDVTLRVWRRSLRTNAKRFKALSRAALNR